MRAALHIAAFVAIHLALVIVASCTEVDIFLEAAGGEGTVYDCQTVQPFRGTTSPEVCFFDDSAAELGDRIGGVCSRGNERKWVILTNGLSVGCAYSCPAPGKGCNAKQGCYCP